MPRSCAAFNCSSKQLDDCTVSFHRFPKDKKLKKLWILATKRKNFNPSNSVALCSKHFAHDDFEVGGIIRKLKKNVIPTIFDFPSHLTPLPPKLRQTRTSAIAQYGPINEEPSFHFVTLPTAILQPEPSTSSTYIPVTNGVTTERRKISIMESYVNQLDTNQEICKVEIKEEVFFELIEDHSCNDGINEESAIIKEEHFELIDDQSVTPNGLRNENVLNNQIKKEVSNDIDQDGDMEFTNEEQEIDYVWSEGAANQSDPLAMPEIIYKHETPKSVESDETPKLLESDETPKLVESDETPKSVESDETSKSVESVESDETPKLVESDETPKSRESDILSSNSNKKDSETSSHKAYYYDPIVKQYIAADRLCDFPHSTSNLIVKNYTCEKPPTSSSELITSITVHTRVKPHKCKECDYSTSKANDLKIHIRKHTGEKPYKCKECEYSATNACSLKRHERIHNGDRPYKCKDCDYSCTHPSTLIRHKKKHTGDRPFKCNKCEYSSIQSSSLRVHMRRHLAKPFKCNDCNYSSRKSKSLQMHMKKHGKRLKKE